MINTITHNIVFESIERSQTQTMVVTLNFYVICIDTK